MNTDPIADLLTRIRNAGAARHRSCEIPASRLKEQVLDVLKQEGYIEDFRRVEGVGYGTLKVRLKYVDRKHVITGIRRESTPGQRRYVKVDEIPVVRSGFGIALLTTSKGVMTGGQAIRDKVGGELLCTVW